MSNLKEFPGDRRKLHLAKEKKNKTPIQLVSLRFQFNQLLEGFLKCCVGKDSTDLAQLRREFYQGSSL
jgi:hypothetical protein